MSPRLSDTDIVGLFVRYLELSDETHRCPDCNSQTEDGICQGGCDLDGEEEAA